MSDTIEYDNILTKGLQSALTDTPIEDGKLRYTTDTGRLYLDIEEEDSTPRRLRISSVEDGLTEEQILSTLVPLPKIYVSSDTHRAFINAGLQWYDLSAVQLSLADITDIDLPLWFSAKDAEQPSYSEDVTYNTQTKTLKIPKVAISNLVITDTQNIDGTHTVRFSFN